MRYNFILPRDLRGMNTALMQTVPAYLLQHRKWLVQTVTLALVYYLGARLGLLLAFEKSNSSPVWPPAGIALAGLLLFGWRLWPGVWLGALVANVEVFAQNQAATPSTIIWVSAVIACGNTMEALFGRMLCDRWLSRSSSEDVVSGMEYQLLSGKLGVFQFAAMGLIAAIVSAWIGPLAVTLSGISSWTDFPFVWISWWFGDASAILLLTPFLLALRNLPLLKMTSLPRWETLAAFGLLVLAVGTVFGEWFGVNGAKLPITFVTIVPLIWIALRIGLRATTTAIVLLTVLSIWNTQHGLGPFTQPVENESLLLLMSYLWLMSCTSLALAGTVTTRWHAYAALQEANVLRDATMAALHESEERFRTMAESAPVLIWISGLEKQCTYFNKTWLDFTGRSMEQELGNGWSEGVHPDDLQHCLDIYTSAFDARQPFKMEYRLRRHDGTYRWLLDHGAPRYADSNRFEGYIGSCVDITENKIAEDTVRQSEGLLRSITDHSTEMIFAKDDRSRIIFINTTGLRIVGLPLEKILGHTDTEIHVDTNEAATFLTNDQRVMEMRMTETIEETLTTSSGGRLTLLTTKTPRLDAAGNVVGIVGVARDITEFKQTQNALIHLNEELEKRVALRTAALQQANEDLSREIAERQRLENDMLHIAEREQRRLGQYLHEELSQHLVGIGFLCRVLSDKLNDENHPKARGVSELSSMLQEALDSTRDLAKSYYPVELETGGLITALQSLAERTSRLFGVNCDFKSDEDLAFFSDSQSAIHFYRIVQEAVTNALKHGKATHIVIECKTTDGIKSITITDDGRGFEPKNGSTGLGLHFMRYRARLVGAEMEVKKPGPNGCSVTCAVKN